MKLELKARIVTMASVSHGDHEIFGNLLNVNVPHIPEEIFFYLDYKSFKRCQGVNKSWRMLLTSESFITKGKSVFQEDLREMERQLLENSTKGDIGKVMRLISCQMVDVNNVQHLWDTTPLCEAAKKGHTDIVRVLLDRGADPNNSGTNCIKIGLPGKSILGDYFQKNMTSQRLFSY